MRTTEEEVDAVEAFANLLDRPPRSVQDAAANVCTAELHTGMVGPLLLKAVQRLREALMVSANKAHARTSDPDTSHQAAAEVTLEMTVKRQAVLDVFNNLVGGMHDELLMSCYNGPTQSTSGLRTRRAELVRMGRLMDSGKKTKNAAGRSVIVWTLTPAK